MIFTIVYLLGVLFTLWFTGYLREWAVSQGDQPPENFDTWSMFLSFVWPLFWVLVVIYTILASRKG